MKRFYRLTTEEYRDALEKAARDDERFPYLQHHKWLIEHTTIKDGEVEITIYDQPSN